MANNSDTSSDERAQRIAELKLKMQEAAKKAKADQAAKEAAAAAEPQAEEAAPEEVAAPAKAVEAAPVAEAVEAAPVVEETADPVPVAEEAVTEAPVSEAESDEAEPVADEAVAVAPVVADVFPSNGDAVAAESDVTKSVFKSPDEITPEMAAKKQMNRREFLTYAWGAALGLAVLQVGAVSFFFMYPRFKAGEFGGAFFMGPESAVPPSDATPVGIADGKFWWVSVEEEGQASPHAIFMVCTHLGCLYKWVGETNRFECPCHGSKFTREGLYIEGPAPRSLDEFEVALVDGEYIVDTGAKITGAPASESEAAAEA